MNRPAFVAQFLERGEVWVGRRMDMASKLRNATQWFQLGDPSIPYQLRAVGAGEVVFDIGDSGDWPNAVRDTLAIHRELRAMYVPHWVALSGGKGIHIHVFGPSRPILPDDGGEPSESMPESSDWRPHFVNAVLDRVFMRTLVPATVDVLLIAPSLGGRLCREFGERKEALSPQAKTLWWQDGEFFLPLPVTREEAYAQAKPRFPKLRPADWLPRYDTTWMLDVEHHACPASPACHDRPAEDWLGCNACPLVAA